MDQPWTTTTIDQKLVRGTVELERTAAGVLPRRLPAWARAQNTDLQLTIAEAQPTGVRLEFRTRATAIELDVLPTKIAYAEAPGPGPDGVYDLLVNGQLVAQGSATSGNILNYDRLAGTATLQPGDPATVSFTDLPDHGKIVQIWLPHNESTELVALRTNAPVIPIDSAQRIWLHHGSSISHGLDAHSPASIWPAVAAARGGVDLVNVAFGGGACSTRSRRAHCGTSARI
ncbi:hypothetical protein [Kribbella sandramycini]|uniref:Uncharacterized protein n=1 Tax=Kribbella sandramycini TaxID=60450 RepID=A0A841SEG6_9ACTN|nr:hypothetical protein [Kribbella sandramycini]MBB6567713.1 hypothetical protein [Kribbella sandramycini]